MKSRKTGGGSDTVGLFPFLAVLLSTMGALLVLLVILAQKAKQQALDPDMSGDSAVALAEADSHDPGPHGLADELKRQLERMQVHQRELDSIREQAVARQREEQLRLSHLEEHARRLEHELAMLHIASVQLKATEENQIIDQDQAEQELERLQELVDQTRRDIDSLREESKGKRSYAIVPYRGPQGTVRRPIYIECSKEGVVIQPEGIRLTAKDFITSFDSGNPLAKALRAARDLLNARSARMGESDLPDPYPLLVIRPDGIQQYQAARNAIKSWDSDFGYEFIDAQWSLQYPVSDPELAQVMQHAVLQGRERIAMLMQNAPRRYGQVGMNVSSTRQGGGNSKRATGWSGGESRQDGLGLETTRANANAGGTRYESRYSEQVEQRPNASSSSGKGYAGGLAENHQGNLSANYPNGSASHSTQPTEGHAPWNKNENDSNGLNSMEVQQSSDTDALASSGHSSDASDRTAQDTKEYSGTAGASSSARGDRRASPSPLGSAGQQASSQTSASGISSFSNSNARQSRAVHGKNWATQSPQRGSVPIRRPIQVIIRKDHLAILESSVNDPSRIDAGDKISWNQPTETLKEAFANALRQHMQDWGLAGNGMHWRPVLHFQVGPQGQPQATRFADLLKGSGVEIGKSPWDTPRTVRKNQEGSDHATK